MGAGRLAPVQGTCRKKRVMSTRTLPDGVTRCARDAAPCRAACEPATLSRQVRVGSLPDRVTRSARDAALRRYANLHRFRDRFATGRPKDRAPHARCPVFWPTRQDSNLRPSESESDALSSCATGRYALYCSTVFPKSKPQNAFFSFFVQRLSVMHFALRNNFPLFGIKALTKRRPVAIIPL